MLKYGIELTTLLLSVTFSDSRNWMKDLPDWEDLNEEQKTIIEKHMVLVKYLDRLELYGDICDEKKQSYQEVCK